MLLAQLNHFTDRDTCWLRRYGVRVMLATDVVQAISRSQNHQVQRGRSREDGFHLLLPKEELGGLELGVSASIEIGFNGSSREGECMASRSTNLGMQRGSRIFIKAEIRVSWLNCLQSVGEGLYKFR